MAPLLFALTLWLTPPAKVNEAADLPARLQLASLTLTGAGKSNANGAAPPPPPPPPAPQFFFPTGTDLILAAATF